MCFKCRYRSASSIYRGRRTTSDLSVQKCPNQSTFIVVMVFIVEHLKRTHSKGSKLRNNLCDQEARHAFRQPPQLAGHDHVQHVSVQLLHNDEDVLRRLEHPLHQDHARVGETLETNVLDQNNPAVVWKRRRIGTCKMAPSFLSCLSCLLGNRVLSMTLMATNWPDFL